MYAEIKLNSNKIIIANLSLEINGLYSSKRTSYTNKIITIVPD